MLYFILATTLALGFFGGGALAAYYKSTEERKFKQLGHWKAIAEAPALYRYSFWAFYASTVFALLSMLILTFTDSGHNGSSSSSSNKGINTIADCQAYLNDKREIESFDEDYKTYYSDGILGMPESPLLLRFEGNTVTFNRCSPTGYTIEKHAGGDSESNNPYYTVTFVPDCTRGDELILYVSLDDKGDVYLLSIESKIFDSKAAFDGDGNPAFRKQVSGPSLRSR